MTTVAAPVTKSLRIPACILLATGLGFSQGQWVDVFNGTDTKGIVEKGGGSIAVAGGNSGFAYHIIREELNCRLPSGIELNISGDDIGTLWWTDVKFKSNGSGSFKATGPAVSLGGFGCSGEGHKSFGRDKSVNPWERSVSCWRARPST